MAEKVKVLSIDGGGIRGIIPAIVLAEIEKRTGKPIAEHFDLIAGTSTGGILTLGMTLQDTDQPDKPRYNAEEIIKLYENKGKDIFSRSFGHQLLSLYSIINKKYPSKGIEEVLQGYFGDARLKDSLTNVMITAYEMEGRFPFFFRSSRAKVNPSYDFPVTQVARATSAAPTYFEPLKLETESVTEYYSLVDGGVYANNPSMCAYVEARSMFPDADEILFVSLGTGQMTQPLLYNKIKNWGLVEWARPVLDVVFDGVSDTVDYQVHKLLPDKSDHTPRYYRFQARLSEDHTAMDDAGAENLRVLKLIARDMLHEQGDKIQVLCDALM